MMRAEEEQLDLNFVETGAHHCDENVDEDNNDRDEIRGKHDQSDFLHVESAVEFCTENRQ